MRYENTVAYHDYERTNVFLTDQTLLRGETVSLIPVEGTFREDGMRRVAIEPKPGIIEIVTVDDPIITVPTELSEDDWLELLENELDGGDSLTVDENNGELILSLDGTYDVAYAPIGLNRVPSEGDRSSDDTEINPAAPGDVSLTGVNLGKTTRLTFNNSRDTTRFIEARINFYQGQGSNQPTNAEVYPDGVVRNADSRVATLRIGDGFADLSPPLEIAGETETDIILEFNNNVQQNNDWFVMTIRFDSGETGLYFIANQN